MNKMKLNPFWAGIGGAVVLLIVAYVYGVMGAKAAQEKSLRSLKGVSSSLSDWTTKARGDRDIEAWSKYRGRLMDNYKELAGYYAEHDKALEQWFPGLPERPPQGQFATRLSDEARNLEESLKKAEIQVGILDEVSGKSKYGLNWETLSPQDWAGVARGGQENVLRVMKELQKRFWARQRIAGAILQSGAKVKQVTQFRFFAKLDRGLQGAEWENAIAGRNEIRWQAVYDGASRAFLEQDLPNGLGRTLTFGFALELPYGEIPKVMQAVAAPGAQPGQQILLNITGAQITIRQQNMPTVSYVYFSNVPGDQKEKEEAALGGPQAPRTVSLAVTCQIIDFDASKIQTFEKKEEAPAP